MTDVQYTAVGYLEKRSTFAFPLALPFGDQQGEEPLEEDDDSAVRLPATRHVNVEFTVLRSATYLVPQLYIRAWDEGELYDTESCS